MKEREFKYSWSFKNSTTLYHETYKTIPELLHKVQDMYTNKTDWFEDNDECIIDLHMIEYFNYEDSVTEYVNSFEDIIRDDLSIFALHTDCEPEFNVDKEFKEKLKNFILKETQNTYFYPQYVGHRLTKRYNLKLKQYEE